MHLLPSWRLTACFVAAALLAIGGSSSAPADDHAPHSPASTVESHGAAAGADHAHAVDYNKPPIPGFATGLVTLFIYSLVLFGVFVFAARSLVWIPLIAALDQRESRVNQAHAEAEAARVQAEHLLAQHSARMAEVHDQVQGIIARARKDAEHEKTRIIAEAEAAAKSLRNQAIADIDTARQSALSQLEGNLDAQVSRAVKQVVGSV